MALAEETPARIEPCLLDEVGAELLDLATSLSAVAANLGARLHPRSAAGLADAVRIMNCYYSNLIEGHNTTPREIEAALQGHLEAAEERRNLQLEARAHIRLQREIDRRHAAVCASDTALIGQDPSAFLVCVRPEAIRVSDPGAGCSTGDYNRLVGTVADAVFTAGAIRYRIDTGHTNYIAERVPPQRHVALRPIGTTVRLGWQYADTPVVPRE
jgi:TOBE domain